MELLPVIGIGIAAVILSVLIRQQRPELAVLFSLAAGVLIFFLIVDRLAMVIDLLQQLAQQASVDLLYFNTFLRIIAIAYITQFASQISKDAGEGAIAEKMELAGKVMIMLLAVPLMLTVLESVLRLLP